MMRAIRSPVGRLLSSSATGLLWYGLPQPQLVAFTSDSSVAEEVKKLAEDFSRREFLPFGGQWEKEKRFPAEAIRRAAGLGFAGMYFGSDMGGSDMPCTYSASVFEALAYGDVPTTAFLTVQNLVGFAVNRYGSSLVRNSILPKLAQLDLMASYCLTEPDSGSDAASLTTKAIRNGDIYSLSGSKAFISGGGMSDIYLVMAQTEHLGTSLGMSAFIVHKKQEGISFGAEEDKMGWRSQPTATVIFDNVRVPKSHLLGKEGDGFKIALTALDRGRINIAACAVGGAQFCLETAIKYSQSRQQFGRPIGHFQNTQFRIADMATALQASRLLVHQAADSAEQEFDRTTLHAAMAKRFATDAAFQISSDAMQILGGYGYLTDYSVERYFRDLRVLPILEGTNEIMRLIINRELQVSQE